jgi:hypothetical protein
MGVHLELEDYDALFRSVTADPIIINNILDTVESERNAFDEKFFVTYTDTDLLDTIPKCRCGITQGQHHVDRKGRGTICKVCKTPVQPVLDKPLEPIIWVQKPVGVLGLINPEAWRLMTDFFSLSNNSNQKFNIIKYLTNTDYRPNRNQHGRWMDVVDGILDELKIDRGLNNFICKFDSIIMRLAAIPQFSSTKDKKEKLKDMMKFISMYRDRIFSDYIPVHNKTILVIENTKFGTYMDTTLKTIIDAVRNFAGIDSEIKDYSISQKENRSSKLSEALHEFGRDYEKNFIAGKPGLVRKHVYATRCWFSFRAVINSLTEPHHHNEIHLPWALAVTTFRIHLMGKLFRRGFGYNDASYYLNYHTHIYSELLDELFDELLNESPYELSPTVEASIVNGVLTPKVLANGELDIRDEPKYRSRRGIPCIYGRNPSMYRTSIQRMFITHIKKDPKIYSISYPITSVSGPNADFDGDQMFGILTLDNWTTDELRYLAPHFGAWKLSGPRQIGDNMPLTKPLVSSTVRYLYDYPEHERAPDPRKWAQMEKMFTMRLH